MRSDPGAAWRGELLRRARRRAGLTQRRLAELMRAELARVEQSHVSRWEHGQAPTADTLARIVRAFRDAGEPAPELLA
jgi:transcriptional regulator with XRE-family HTH domain